MSKEVATPESPAVSPSNKYILVINSSDDAQGGFYSFQIQNQDRQVLYVSPDRFASRHTTYFLWDQNDRVWVYSGDVGTFFWERKQNTHEWEKNSYAQSNLPAPEFLRKMRPQFFKK
ncbi:MAG TPA: hypothetical protein DEG47_07820 [Cyanobacteria bacterium UBA11148]|nr:hypothetical protein [Cyanobacteria bacterium UBA11148]